MNKTAKNNHKANRHIMRALNLIESQGFGGKTQDKKSFGISWRTGTRFVLTKLRENDKVDITLEVRPLLDLQLGDDGLLHEVEVDDDGPRTYPMQCRVLSYTVVDSEGNTSEHNSIVNQDVAVEKFNSGEHNESYNIRTLHYGTLRGFTLSHIITD